jgi:hypothetical protein
MVKRRSSNRVHVRVFSSSASKKLFCRLFERSMNQAGFLCESSEKISGLILYVIRVGYNSELFEETGRI